MRVIVAAGDQEVTIKVVARLQPLAPATAPRALRPCPRAASARARRLSSQVADEGGGLPRSRLRSVWSYQARSPAISAQSARISSGAACARSVLLPRAAGPHPRP